MDHAARFASHTLKSSNENLILRFMNHDYERAPRAYIRRASEKHRSGSALGGQRVESCVGSEALFQMSKFDWKKDALRETRSHHDIGESFDDLP
jgi:hypothetical protein